MTIGNLTQTGVVEGFDELYKTFDELAEEIGQGKTNRIWKKALGFAFEPVLRQVKSSAPVDSGQLLDHVYMDVHRPQGRDRKSPAYQGEVFMARVTVAPQREDSVTRTTITKSGKESTVSYNRPVALANEFGTAKMAGKPFIRPALEANVQNVIDRLGQAIWYEMNWGKYAKGK